MGAVSVCTGFAVLAGFALDVLLVARFGISSQTDAFFAAYTLPLVLITCIAALQPALVSLLAAEPPVGQGRTDQTAGHQAGPAAGNSLFSILLNITGLAALTLAVAGVLGADPLLGLTAPGFSAPTAALAAGLARVLFWRVPAAAAVEVLKAGLYARRRFLLPTLANALPSLIAAALLLSAAQPSIGLVAVGLVLGTLVQLVLLAALLFAPRPAPYRLRWPSLSSLRAELPALRRAMALVLAPLAGLLLRQVVTLAERVLGSFLPAGSLTVLSYASRLTMVAAGVFFDSLTTVSLPSLAAAWARGAGDTARAIQGRLLGITVLVALPLGLATAALSTPLVRVFFQRGQVDPHSAQLLTAVFGLYALSLPSLGPYRAVQTFFYAVKQPGPIIVLHGLLAALTVALDLVLMRSLGATGLAIAFAASSTLTLAAGLAWLARRAGGPLNWRQLADSAWRLGLTATAAAAVLFWSSQALDTVLAGAGRWSQAAALGMCGLAGLLVFMTVGAILHLEPIAGLWQLISHRRRQQEG